MTASLALLFMLAVPRLEVSLAPDQPVPYIYVDDPLILQIKSNEDVQVTGDVKFTRDDGYSVSLALPEIALRAQGSHWQALDGAPKEKGLYHARVTLKMGDTPFEATPVFCRIDRPAENVTPPLSIRLNAIDAWTVQAIQGIPIRRVELDAGIAELGARIDEMTKAGCQVGIFIDPSRHAGVDVLAESIAKGAGEKVVYWSVSAGVDVPTFETVVGAIRRGGSRSPVSFGVKTDEELASLFSNGSKLRTKMLTLYEDAPSRARIAAVRSEIESAGYEAFPLNVCGTGLDEAGPHVGARLVRQLILNRAIDVTRSNLTPEFVVNGGQFGDAFVHVSAMVHRLNGSAYVGELPIAPPVYAEVFRDGNAWTLVAWCTDGKRDIGISVGSAEYLSLADSCNNTLAAPTISDGTAMLAVSEEPLYLSGVGGAVVVDAARNTSLQEARRFVETKEFQNEVPKELMDIVKTIASSKSGRPERIAFFAMLRMFPVIEQRWHEGSLPQKVAVPAMAAMVRLIRGLCVLEQESAEPFIELLQETLARCAEYQSQYLTSTGGTGASHERGDWLLAEISRLTAEAKVLNEQGRGIEAVGVASMAEWRARALEFAAKAAPLNGAGEVQAAASQKL